MDPNSGFFDGHLSHTAKMADLLTFRVSNYVADAQDELPTSALKDEFSLLSFASQTLP